MSEVIECTQTEADWSEARRLYGPGLMTAIHNAIVGKLPKVGLNYVVRALVEPSRSVESSVKNSAGRFPSRKLGRSIGFESSTLEYPTALNKELDRRCLALLDQGPSIRVRARSQNRWVSYWHKPDFVCVEEGRVVLIECKSLEGIEKKNATNPGFFVFEGGQWICPTAIEEAKQYGFDYEVWTELMFTDVELRNAMIVDAYLCGSTHVYDRQVEILQRHMESHGAGKTSLQLLEELNGEITVDGVYAAIARGAVAFDLRSGLLTTHSTCQIFRDWTTLRAHQNALAKPLIEQQRIDIGGVDVRVGTQVMWNAVRWRCMSMADNKIVLAPNADIQPVPIAAYQPLPLSIFLMMVRSSEMTIVDPTPRDAVSDKVASMIQSAKKDALEEANRRYVLIIGYLARDAEPPQSRTIRRYIESYRRALAQLGNGYVGLLPRWSDSGNSEVRIAGPVMRTVQQFINDEYLTPEKPSALAVYRRIVESLEADGYIAPSYRWFCRLIKAMPIYETMLARTGRKGAYKYEPRVVCVDRNARPVAERAFEMAHIDHTKIDVVTTTEGEPVRLWLTVMLCSATRRVLAWALSFEPPSYRQVMLVMRDCVKRHNRLPEIIMVDGGKEFHSVWFETVCALYHVVVRRRPKSKARFGVEMERFFGTANTSLFHTLIGNTQNTRNVRQMTPEVDPYRRAIWTVSHLKSLIEQFFFEDYDQKLHTTLLMSPRHASANSQALHGSSPHRFLSYDETFLILTSSTTRKGKAQVQPDGVKINYLYFNHPSLRPHIGTSLPVRFDPFNIANAWAQLNGAWVKLTSRYASVLVNHSEHDVAVVTAAWRARRSEVEKEVLTDPPLIRLLHDIDTQEEWLTQQQQSRAERQLRETDAVVFDAPDLPESQTSPPAASDPPGRPAQRLQLHSKLVEVEVLQ